MPTERHHPRDSRRTMGERLARLEVSFAALTRAGVNVTRKEHDDVLKALEQVGNNQRTLEVQFTRIAQLQAELDVIRRAWERMKIADLAG